MTTISDGTGTGFSVKVNEENRLYTFADSVPSGAIGAINSRMWSVASGDITLTDDTESACLFLRYTGNQRLLIQRIIYQYEDSTGGSGDNILRFYKNPTEGTIVSNASNATVTNRNFSGVPGSLLGDKFKGAQGNTLTDGDIIGTNRNGPGFYNTDTSTSPFVLEKGNSIGFTVQPPSGNTSQLIRVFLIVYEIVI